MKVLFIGDIVARSGRSAVKALLPDIVERFDVRFVIANGENLAGGFGLTEKVANETFGYGVHVITSGNHIWDKKEAIEYLDREKRVLRPINYPPGSPGFGSIVFSLEDGTKIAVINISGRVFMPNLDCPFRAADEEIDKVADVTKNIVVDFHAEATSEKIAMGYYLDGKVSAVLGSHTHVQTADDKILKGGTAYITDVGMTGPEESIIGVEKNIIIERFLNQMPLRFEAAKGPAIFSAVIVDIDEMTGRSRTIERLLLRHS